MAVDVVPPAPASAVRPGNASSALGNVVFFFVVNHMPHLLCQPQGNDG